MHQYNLYLSNLVKQGILSKEDKFKLLKEARINYSSSMKAY